MAARRSRSRAISPLGQIIRWFLGAGLAEAEQALETAQAIVERKRDDAVQAAATMAAEAKLDIPRAFAPVETAAPKPRAQRRQRSDAGQPRRRGRRSATFAEAAAAAANAAAPTAAAGPVAVAPIAPVRRSVRRQPAPVVVAGAGVAAGPVAAVEPLVGALPDSFVPPEAEEGG